MIIAGIIFTLLAIALHFFIFYLESFAWKTKALSVFGMSREQAEQTEEMAFNQGFYNLFLAIIALVGVIMHFTGSTTTGMALMLAGVGSMLAAALLLFVTSPDKRSAAIKQGVFPLLAVVALLVGVAL